MPSHGSKTALLDDLRRRIAHLEHPVLCQEAPPPALALGVAEIDAHLPWGGLAPAALHEIVPAKPGDGATALGFAAALLGLAARKAAVLWCRSQGDLYAPGLKPLGLTESNLIIINTSKDRDLLWAMEEGLRSGALAAVLGEIRNLSPTATRRLQLAAEDGGTLAFLAHSRAAAATMTRWQVAAAASRHPRGNWPGKTCWHVRLERCRGAGGGQWFVEWHDDDNISRDIPRNTPRRISRKPPGKISGTASGFRLVAAFRDGSLRPAAADTAQPLPLQTASAR
ncbi:MAG: hypothetical protein HOH04_15905 [Rhodospirillaceae bacterium]|jgi:protein ImuA|nr:hypothetical protein [Rhodospirillaceae bacterium]